MHLEAATVTEIASELRDLAKQGASVADLLRTIQRRLDRRHVPYESILLLRTAFKVPLGTAIWIGDWSGFAPEGSPINDARLDDLLGPAIQASLDDTAAQRGD